MEKYKIIQKLGDGCYGSIYKGIQKTGEFVAIKKMKKSFYSWNECLDLREIRALNRLTHPNIIKLREIIKVQHVLYLIFDYMDQNLLDYYQSHITKKQLISNSTIKFIIYQVAKGLFYIHNHSIFHRDLRPENILIQNESKAKICDFRLSQSSIEKPPYSEYTTTGWYLAPEILLKAQKYGSEVDIFALGCIMAELYMLSPLFTGANEIDQLNKMCKILGSPIHSSWPDGMELAKTMGFRFAKGMKPLDLKEIIPNADPEAIDLMQKMLKWNPELRIKAKDIVNHPYFLKDVSISLECKREEKILQSKKTVILSVSSKLQRQQTPISHRVSYEQNMGCNTSFSNIEQNSTTERKKNIGTTEYLNYYGTNSKKKTRDGQFIISNLITEENSLATVPTQDLEENQAPSRKSSLILQNSPIISSKHSKISPIRFKDLLNTDVTAQNLHSSTNTISSNRRYTLQSILHSNINDGSNFEDYAIDTKLLSEQAGESRQKYIKPLSSLQFPHLEMEFQGKYFRGRQCKPNLSIVSTKINTHGQEYHSRRNIRSLGLSVNKHKDKSIPSDTRLYTQMNNSYFRVQNDHFGLFATSKTSKTPKTSKALPMITKENSQELEEKNKISFNDIIMTVMPRDYVKDDNDIRRAKIGILNNIEMRVKELNLQSKQIQNKNKKHYPNILMPVVLDNESEKVIEGILNKSQNHNKKTDIHNFSLIAKFKADIHLKKDKKK